MSTRAESREPHIAALAEVLFRTLRTDLKALDGRFPGMRSSQYRLLALVPDDGARLTEVVPAAGMTKQALGQFVRELERLGYLSVEIDPADRRARIVRRTRRGDAAVEAALATIAAMEHRWRQQVGERRYATFRRVLVELDAASQPMSE